MRKLFILLIIAALAIPLAADQEKPATAFLGTAENIAAGATATNGSEFTSVEIQVSEYPSYAAFGAIEVTFTRAAGAADTVDFYFQASMDQGTSWATYDLLFKLATNTTVVSGTTVRYIFQCQWNGITHIRLWKIVKNDGANALTACNARIAIGTK